MCKGTVEEGVVCECVAEGFLESGQGAMKHEVMTQCGEEEHVLCVWVWVCGWWCVWVWK